MDRRVKERLVGATILVVLIVLIVPELLSGPRARVIPVSPRSVAGPSDAVRNVTVDLATSKATPADNTAPSAASVSSQSTPAADAAVSGDAASGDAASGNAQHGNEAPGDAAAPGEALTAGSSAPPGEGAAGAPAATGRANRTSAPPTIATLRAQQPARSAQSALESEPSTPRSPPQVSKLGNAHATAPAGAPGHHWAVQLGSFVSRANAEKLVSQRKPRNASLYVWSSGKGASVRYRVRIGPLADRDAAERLVAKLKKEGQPASLVPP
jgi:DedD protein